MKRGLPIRILFCAVLLSVFFRSLIPVGFMAENSSNMLTICSGITTKTIFVGDTSTPPGHHSEQKSEPCPFAPPVLADTSHDFDVSDYISIAYLPYLPDPTAHLSVALIAVKTFNSQGPPENFVV